MVPNVSTLDDDGCGWICLNPGCPELAAGEDDSLVVSYHSDDFAEAQEAKQALIAVGALCGVIRRTSDDAQAWLAHIDSGLPGYSLPPSSEASRLAIVHPASPSSLSCAASPSGRLFA
jgi:hypothetical protein